MLWILEYFVVYLLCIYVRLVMTSYLLLCCTRVSTLMLGVLHATQNKKFTQSDSVYLLYSRGPSIRRSE